MQGRIFVNYRRSDDQGTSGRLYDWLEREFGAEQIFMDTEGIGAGDIFAEVLRARVARCDVLLALIGPHWLDARDVLGRRRLELPGDWVRFEIASALEAGKHVIPILVGEATMPNADDLPADLHPLAGRQAMRVTTHRFKADAADLIERIKTALARVDAARAAAREAERSAQPPLARKRVGLPHVQGKYILAIVSNERVFHINRAKDGFYEEFRALVDKHQLIDEIGSADSDAAGCAVNRRAFEKVFAYSRDTFKRDPDLLVTVGTQVSVHAARHFPTTPRFFFSVSDPVASELITADERFARARPVAGFANGIDRAEMVRELVRYFPGRAFGFAYGPQQAQDMQMLRYLQSPEARAIVPIATFLPLDVERPRFDARALQGVDIVFGWNLLNTNINHFIANNPGVPFISQHVENETSDAIASFGLDFRDLGVAAARFLVREHFDRKRPLGELPIDFSHRMNWHFNRDQIKGFGLEQPATDVPI